MTAATNAPSFLRDALKWVRAERSLPEYTPNQRSVVARYTAAAEQRLRCARDATLYPAVAAGLMRDALGFIVRAAVIGRDGQGPSVDTVAALARLREATGRVVDDEDARRIVDAIEASTPLYFDAMDPAELVATQEALEREVLWLRTQVDLRTPAYRKGARIGRTVGLALLGVWAIYALLFHVIFRPKNLAFEKPVKASSHQPGTPDPSGLTDGKIASNYGFHTDVGQHDAWALIDLEKATPIRKIVVFNRSDTNPDDSLPIALDVSTDGASFHEVAHRAEHFGDGSPFSPAWSASVHEYGRYVRVRSKRYLALNEVEVF